MTHSEARHRSISGMDVCMALAALAGAVLLLFAATQSQAQTYSVLHTFSGPDGSIPFSGVTLDGAGRLYGTTYEGGEQGEGVVYRVSPSAGGWTETVLYNFGDGDCVGNMSRVLFGPDGILYGTTPCGGAGGAGTVFSLSPPPSVCHAITCSWTKTVLYSFTGGSDGGWPQGDLRFDAAGNIYGNATDGGIRNGGVVFKLTRSGSTWTESVLYSFTGTGDGCDPVGGVVFDSAGNIYGTTRGDSCHATIYQLAPSQSGWTETTLYTFTPQDLGYTTGLTIDPHGNLFGFTGQQGGTGVAWELSPVNGNWIYSRAYIFPQGYEGPWDVPTLDARGNVYGTLCCAPGQAGAVIQLMPSGLRWNFTSLYEFTGGSDGGVSTGGVAFDSSGNLYGTTGGGGRGENGVVWEITP